MINLRIILFLTKISDILLNKSFELDRSHLIV